MNNIEKISSFLFDKSNTVIILPKINDEVVIFYQMLIQKIAEKNSLICKKVNEFKKLQEMTSPSLFEEKNIYIIDTSDVKNTSRDLSLIDDKTQKFFIFMNYASYKKNLMGSLQINTYNFKNDMSFFLINNLVSSSWDDKEKIDFLNFTYNSPHLFFSELEKLDIHILNLHEYESKRENIESISSTRKEIFKYKNDFSLKILSKLYSLIKKEVSIKKFTF